MTTIRRLALVAVLVLALAVPAYAAVTYQSGRYEGHTSQKNSKGKHRKISFHADFDAGEITNIKFVSTGTCTDGGDSHGTQGGKGSNLYANPNANGDFKFTTYSKNKATKLTMRGHIEGRKANGTFKVTSRYDKQGNSDPNGSVTCTSHQVTWSAKKVS
jgi:pullulanase/glycogen debranching enzyme